MSRIDELKKQYPELNISMFDIICRIDTSKTYKYAPLLCKIFGERFNVIKEWGLTDIKSRHNAIEEIKESLRLKGVSFESERISELYALHQLSDFYHRDDLKTLKEFIEKMDKNLIENKDVTSYKDLPSIRSAISLASLKELNKELESQVIKEYEDNTWVIVRPLTFQASAKYGASTKWCTTYQSEKQYFERYWKRGILLYFINKLTGYKFACFKSLDGDKELSFWNAADTRIDYLDVEADDYLFPIVRKILKSDKTNLDFCTEKLMLQVMKECNDNNLKQLVVADRAYTNDTYQGELVNNNHNEIIEESYINSEAGYDIMEEPSDMEEAPLTNMNILAGISHNI